jgi:3-hydroxyisobutyrate dehydrogenase
MRVGFVGTGVMGQPMALNLARQVDVVAWNRTPDRLRALAEGGAAIARDVDEVFTGCDVVLLMLADGQVVDEVLGRGTPRFAELVAGRTVVTMGTTAPSYSADLEQDVLAAGGSYVESPVSGSRQPAQDGTLVAMLAGRAEPVDLVRPLLAPMCRQSFVCGPVPSALTMACELYRGKLAKLVAGDLSVQARLADVRYNTDLIAALARSSGTATPLLDVARELFREAEALGHGGLDMLGVVHAVAARSAAP